MPLLLFQLFEGKLVRGVKIVVILMFLPLSSCLGDISWTISEDFSTIFELKLPSRLGDVCGLGDVGCFGDVCGLGDVGCLGDACFGESI